MVNANSRQSDDQDINAKDLDKRKSDATSDETLSDLEETESESDTTDRELDPGPSPDGLLDEPDEINDAGPM